MKMLRYLSIVMVFSASTMGAKPQSEWLAEAGKRMVTEVLPNGLSVVCYPIPGQYNVRVGITYDVGAKDELPGEYGLAHMIEHMIFKGTDKMSETDLKEIAEKFCIGRIGQGFQALTSRDTTRYYFNTDKDNYKVFLDILADCMFNVRFDEHHFASEVKAVIEELNLRSANVGAFMYDTFSAMMYPFGHSYHHSIIGFKESLLKTTNEDLRKFYKRNYHPSRAVLTIVGDIDTNQALALARKAFNTTVALPERREAKEKLSHTQGFGRKKVVAYKPIPNAEYFFGWKTPAGSENETFAHCVATILSNRLHRIAKLEKDLVLGVSASIIPERLSSFFIIGFSPKQDRSVKEIKALIAAEFDKLMDEGPTENELTCYKKSVETAFLHQFETAGGVGSLIDNCYFPKRDLSEIFKDFSYSQSVTQEDIKAFTKNYLRSLLMSRIVCLPIPEDEQDHWNTLRQEEDTYEKTILEQKIRESAVEPARHVHTLPEPQIAEFKSEKPDKIMTLSNGLTVCVKQRESTPFISGSLCFKHEELLGLTINAAHDEIVRHLALGFINHGTATMTADQLREFFEAHGATCGFGLGGASFNCPSDRLNVVVSQMLDMMQHPKYDVQLVNQQVQTIVQQLQMAKMSPGYMASRLLGLELGKAYPWTINDEQICEKLQSVTRDDLCTFNKKYLRPDTMCLVMVGNIDLATIERDLEKSFGTWKVAGPISYELIKKTMIPAVTNPVPKEILYTIPVDQVVLALGRISTYAETDDMFALAIIQSYVDRQLFAIREQTGLFYTGQAQLKSSSLETKGIALAVFPLSVNNVEAAEKAIKDTLFSIAEHGVPEEHIVKAKQLAQMELVKAFSSNSSVCNSLAYLMTVDKPWDTFETRLKRLQSLTKKEIDAVAKEYLDPRQWTTVKAGRVQNPTEDPSQEAKSGLFSWLL